MITDTKLQDVLAKVRGLLAKADSTEFPAEADAFRKGAEALMFKYRLDESQLTAEERVARAIQVGWRTFVVCDSFGEFASFYRGLFSSVVRHVDCRLKYEFTRDDKGDPTYSAHVCGYESDLAFVDLIWTAASLAFRSKLEPAYDPNESDQVNAYRMRMAGMEGRRIAMAIYGKDDKSLRPKVRAMFAAEAKARGEDPKVLTGRGVNVKMFRESYAQAFVQEFESRLWRMRMENADGSMVLASRKDEINEAFYTRFEDLRPKPRTEIGAHASAKPCEKCAKAKSGYCADHRWMKPRKARVRYGNAAGFARGADAARTVDIGVTGRKLDASR